MKHISHTRQTRSRIFAAAMTLMLLVGICCPAASASADSLLSTYKDEIADAIVTVRENLETLEEDIAAIQQEVEAREAAKKAASGESGESGEPAGEETSGEPKTGLADAAAAVLDGLASGKSDSEGEGAEVSQKGLADVAVSDIHDIDSDVNVKHDITVNVDTSRFNNNTIIRIRETTPSRTPVTPSNPSTTTTAPKTGDLNNIVVWIVIVAVSALAIAVIAYLLLRRKGGKSKGSHKK